MAGPLALIGPALKMLASQGVKKAAMETAKGAAKNKAKDFVTGKGRKKKGKKGKGGALVKSEGGQEEGSQEGGGAIVPTTPIVGKYRVETPPQKPDEVGKPSKVSYEAINNQLDSIVGLTEALKKTSMAKMKTATNRRKAERKAEEKAKQRSRESLLERGAVGAIGAVGGVVSKAAPFDPLKFFTMIFLGSLLTWIMTHGSKISVFLRMTLALMNNFGKLVKAGFTALKNVFKLGFKTIGKLASPLLKVGKNVGKTLFNVGKRLGSAFTGLGKRLFKFVKGLLGRLRIPGFRPPTPEGGQPPTPKGPTLTGSGAGLGTAAQQRGRSATAGFRSPGRYRAPGEALAGGTFQSQQARAQLKGPQATVRPGSLTARTRQLGASLETGTLFGGKGARFQRGANRFLKMLFGITKPDNIKKLSDSAPVLKKAGKFMKGARIPVVGPMIVFTLTALDPNPETGGIGRAAFKAIGTGLGEFLGFGIPIPVLGPIIGSLVGEVMGDAAYELIVNKSPSAAGKKIMDAVESVGDIGGKILDWAKGFVGRFFDALPKLKVPGWIPGIGGKEIIDPTAVIGPRALIETPKAFMTALFQPEKKEKGEVKEDKTPNQNQTAQPQTSVIPSSTSPMSMSIGNVSGGNSDFWTLVAVASREDGDGQARADIAQSIYNRKASGAYGSGSIRDLILAKTQYQPTWDYPRKNGNGYGNPNDEWYNIVDAETAAAATGLSVKDIQIAASQIQNARFQEEARKFVGGRTDFTNYTKSNRHGEVVRTSNSPNNYFGWDWNYKGNTMGSMPNFNTTTTQPPAQPPQPSVQPQTPMVPGSVTPSQSQQPSVGPQLGGLSGHSGSVSYNGQQQASLSVAYSPFAQSDITSQGMQIISGKGYRQSTNSVHKGFDVPALKGTPVYAYLPGKITQNRSVSGYGNIVEWQDSIYGEKHMFAHLMEPGPLPVGTEFQAGTLLAKTGDTGTPGSYHLHWEIGAQGSEKDPAAWVAAHPIKDVPQAQVQQQSQQPRGIVTPSTGSVTTGPQSSSSTTPAQVSPSPQVQTQRSNEITGVSQQLPYEQVGGTTILMAPGSSRGGGTMVGRTSAGTPVIVGSGDVVNSYYKSQLLGFLYKQG